MLKHLNVSIYFIIEGRMTVDNEGNDFLTLKDASFDLISLDHDEVTPVVLKSLRERFKTLRLFGSALVQTEDDKDDEPL